MLDFLDDHSGSIVALSTIALTLVTAAYVIFTYRLVRSQNLGAKREIVEKAYKPISDGLNGMIWGDWPSFRLWTNLKDTQPFLAYHHLIPAHIRKSLDRLASDWMPGGEKRYKRLLNGVNASAISHLSADLPGGRVAILYHVPSYSGWRTIRLDEFLLTNKGLEELLSAWELDVTTQIELQLENADGGILPNNEKIELQKVRDLVEAAAAELASDTSLSQLRSEHRTFIRKVERLYKDIRREVERSSRV